MKIVMQCSGSKAHHAGTFKHAGKPVKFVARPELGPEGPELYARPDDRIPGASSTWRDHLEAYNRDGTNPDRLARAGELYSPPAYGALLRTYGHEALFILSAGWGLVRSEFLLPTYDITFSAQASSWVRRRKSDRFRDFNHMHDSHVKPDESIYFFGGRDYLPLFYDLTRAIRGRKIIYVAAAGVPREPGYEYIDYGSKGTNWHYRCVSDFPAGRVAK